MIHTLFTLNCKYNDQEIYIWDINRDAVAVFTLLACRKINIAGFVSANDEFIGQRFVNRNIVGIEHLAGRDDVLLIVSDHCSLSDIRNQVLIKDAAVLHYSEVLSLNGRLRNKGVIVYGIGEMGEEVYDILNREGINIESFCTSEKGNIPFFHDKPVIAFDDMNKKEMHSVIIAVRNDAGKIQIQRKLEAVSVEHIFVDEIVDPYFDQEVFFPAIHKAITEHKKIYIYGSDNQTAELLEHLLAIYGIGIEGYVNDRESMEQNILSVYDLCYLELSEIFVIINECEASKLQRMCETLDQIGLSLEDFNYTSFRRTTVDYRYVDFHAPDTLVGSGLLVNKEFPGFFVYGDHKDTDIRILVLGGSTSADGTYRPQCWSRYLYEKMLKEGLRATVFNCAYPGQDVVQELLHLVRDGFALKPDIVISMSGVNNLVYKDKVVNQFNVECHMDWIRALDADCDVISGLNCEEKLCDFWFRIERIMKAVSKIYGAQFYGFLQPMKCAKEKKDLFETSVFQTEKSKKTASQYQNSAIGMQGIINLISRFHDEEGMFIDFCHYSDKGNKLLADIVYQFLIDDVNSRLHPFRQKRCVEESIL